MLVVTVFKIVVVDILAILVVVCSSCVLGIVDVKLANLFVVELTTVAVTHVRVGSEMLTFELALKFTLIVPNVVH
jgi:hypothetical protein